MNKQILAIDPSVNHLGWALIESEEGEPITLRVGTIDAPDELKLKSIVQRLEWMLKALSALNLIHTTSAVAIELPETWGAYKSTASSRSGSLQILTLLVGAITAWAVTLIGAENVKLVKVSQHKGQLNKKEHRRRIEQRSRWELKTEHEVDAVSIGYYVIERANHGL